MKLDNPTHYRHEVYQSAVTRMGITAILLLSLSYFLITSTLMEIAAVLIKVVVGAAVVALVVGVLIAVISCLMDLWDWVCGG